MKQQVRACTAMPRSTSIHSCRGTWVGPVLGARARVQGSGWGWGEGEGEG